MHPVNETPPGKSSLRRLVNERWDLALVALALVYFAVRLVFFAVEIDAGVPPDEVTHVGRSEIFAGAWLIPADGPETYRYGPIRDHPFLFYVVMGKLLAVNVTPISDLVWLRLWNALFGLLTVVYGYRWIKLVTDNWLVHVLTVVMMTNVLMFTGISASVNYDNLNNLLGAMAIFYLFAYLKDDRLGDLGRFALAIGAGCLNKISFPPLALILVLVLVFHRRAALYALPRRLVAALRTRGWRAAVLWGAVAVVSVITLELYAGNLARYGRLVPTEDQVMGHENAMKNRIYARNYIIQAYRKGEVTFEQAVEMTAVIKNPGNRFRALSALRLLRSGAAVRASLAGPELYSVLWVHMMLEDGLGYHGHRVIRKRGAQLYPALLILAVAVVAFIRHWRPARDRLEGYGVAVVFLYAMVLMWVVNYPIYKTWAMPDFVLQGRYMFPVLAPLCGLVALYLLRYFPPRAQVLVALGAALYFIYGDLPYFLLNVTACWFRGGADLPDCGAV